MEGLKKIVAETDNYFYVLVGRDTTCIVYSLRSMAAHRLMRQPINNQARPLMV